MEVGMYHHFFPHIISVTDNTINIVWGLPLTKIPNPILPRVEASRIQYDLEHSGLKNLRESKQDRLSTMSENNIWKKREVIQGWW